MKPWQSKSYPLRTSEPRGSYSYRTVNSFCRYEILEAYHEIHKAGVLHCEANPRHWRKTGDHIRVIGFDCAKDLSLEPESESKQACEFEIRRVRAILRLPDDSL